MKLLILHLSDIHLKGPEDIAIERFIHVAKAIANVEVDLQAAIIALSGDIAFSGVAPQYELAATSIETLKRELSAKLRGVPVYVVGVPGNHDCDFSHLQSARSILIDSIAKAPSGNYGADVLSQCTAVQLEYFHFLDRIQAPARTCNMGDAYYEFLVPVGSSSVLIKCYNTAMCSVLRESPGNLAIPGAVITHAEQSQPSDYVVSLFHHPYNWFSQYNTRTFRKHIDAHSDLILTGHEHDSDNFSKYTRRGESLTYLEGAAFQEHDNSYSGFNAIWINLSVQQHKIIPFAWNESLFEPTVAHPSWQPFRRTARLISRDFLLAQDMEQNLDDAGARFVHPTKQNITLQDIYVFPDARAVSTDPRSQKPVQEHVDGKNLLQFITNKRRLMVLGNERAGKTSLAKVLFRDFYAKSFIPVLLQGEQITKVDLESFTALVEHQLNNQYQNPKLPQFNQLDRDQTVILIDDFDHCSLSPKGRQKVLSNIHKRFERIVVFTSLSFRMEEAADTSLMAGILSEYTQLELKEFGYVLRSRLIEKWCRLGTEYSLSEPDIEAKITRYETLVDNSLEKSYLPSLPFFILILVQSLDASEPVSASAGSYGHLCELLITRSLAVSHKAATLNTKKTFLAELAYHLFVKGVTAINEEEFAVFHEKHCSKYNLRLDRHAVFNELQHAAILARAEDQLRFKYPYYLHYFIALHLKDHLGEPDSRKHIEVLCKKLHKEDNANIWLFLSHHSKDPILVDLILAHAKTLFAEAPVAKLQDDLAFFNQITEKIPAVVLFNRTPAELREERRRQLDASKQEHQDATDPDLDNSEFMNFVAELNDAFRTLDVMGQIVKNFSGSLVAPVKFQLVEECYRLGLRVVGVLLSMWKDDPERIINDLVDAILEALKDHKDLTKITRQELVDRVQSLFCLLTEMAVFSLLKRISHAVGASELVPTYGQVREANPINSFKLVDMSIKLDTLRLPTTEVISLFKELDRAPLCHRLLKDLVVHHIYLYSTDYKTKQQICEALNIPIKELRGIDVRFADQKRLPDGK